MCLFLCQPNSLVSYLFSVCLQQVPEKTKESPGTPWQFVGLLPLFDPPRHDSAETIRRALNLGVNVKMITGRLHFPLIFVKCHDYMLVRPPFSPVWELSMFCTFCKIRASNV